MKKRSWIFMILIVFICTFTVACGKEEAMITVTNKNEIEKWRLTAEELEECQPQAYDLELATKKGLADGKNYSDMYYDMQAAYRMVLCEYLKDTYELDTYDNEIAESELRVIAAEEEDMSIYHKHASSGLTYIFLRNNIYIEQLEASDLELMKQALASSENLYDQLVDMVIKTYPVVIKVIFPSYGDEGEHAIIYEAGGFGVNEALNTSLVLGIGYEWEFDKDGMLVDTKMEQLKEEYLEELKNVIVEEVGSMIDIPVTVFIYN